MADNTTPYNTVGREKVMISTVNCANFVRFRGTHCDRSLQHVCFFLLYRVCLCEETAKQEGREGEKVGVEGGEREESTPKLVAARVQRELALLSKLHGLSKKLVGQIRETPEQ